MSFHAISSLGFSNLRHLFFLNVVFHAWWRYCFSISDHYASSPVAGEKRKGLLSGLWWQQDVGLTLHSALRHRAKHRSSPLLLMISCFSPSHITRDRFTLLLSQIPRPIIDVFEDPRQFISKAKMKALAWGKECQLPQNSRGWKTRIILTVDTKTVC